MGMLAGYDAAHYGALLAHRLEDSLTVRPCRGVLSEHGRPAISVR